MRGKAIDLARAVASPACPVAAGLQTKIAGDRDGMPTFGAFPGGVEATGNASERHLRPGVVQRKVANGFRVKWAADHDAARLEGIGRFQTIRAAIG